MSPRDDRLSDLSRIATLLSDRALAPVADATARIDAARGRIAAISAHRDQLSAPVDEPVQAALMAQQAERLRHSQSLALSELARLHAELETAKAGARPAFGRRQVLEQLVSRQKPRG